MQINRRRITNGLAWAGLFVVVAVPLADAVSGQLMGDKPEIAVASVDSPADPIAPIPAPLNQRPHAPVVQPAPQVAAVTPAKPAAPSSSPVVDNFLASGKKLPSYITGGDAPQQAAVAAPAKPAPVAAPSVAPVQVATTPGKPVVPAAVEPVDPIEVATVTPAVIAPMPMPLSMRPKPVTQPLASRQVNEDIVLPPEMVAGNNRQPVVVDDLDDWETGPLSEFLAQRQRQQQSSATVTNEPAYYDNRRNRAPRYLGPVEDADGY